MANLEPIFPEVVDSTMRSDYDSCAHKFELQRIYGLAAKGGSTHLIAGGAFAKGCEVARRSFYLHGHSEEHSVYLGTLAAWEHYGEYEPEEKYVSKSAERVAYALVEYFTEYPMATDRVQPYFGADGKPAIEFEFSFPLETVHPETGNPLLYGGRFDMVGSYMSGLWVVDEKTTTRLGPTWLRSFTLRAQLIGYCYAARLFGLPVNGFIVRGVSFLRDYYGHAEVIEHVPEYRLNLWREQIEEDFAKAVIDWKRGRFGYSLGEACNNYGGCPFRNTLCDKESWKDWWEGGFDIARWNPLEQREVREDDYALPQATTFSS